jgi:hypothetical protein
MKIFIILLQKLLDEQLISFSGILRGNCWKTINGKLCKGFHLRGE